MFKGQELPEETSHRHADDVRFANTMAVEDGDRITGQVVQIIGRRSTFQAPAG